MNDPMRRLVDETDTQLADMLRSSLGDEPSGESAARTARALGFGASAAAAATATAGVAKGAGALKGTAATAVAATKSTVGVGAAKLTAGGGTAFALSPLAKWLAISTLVGGAVTATVALNSGDSKPEATTLDETPAAAQVAPPVRKATLPGTEGRGTEKPAEKPAGTTTERSDPVAAGPSAAVRTPPSVPSKAPEARSDLEIEVAALDAARRALNGGNPSAALGELDRYERTKSPHTLAAEARVLRVRALVAAGRTAEAQRIARGVLERRGSDGYACRIAKTAGIAASGCPGTTKRSP